LNYRFFPQLLVLCPSAPEPWLWDLFEAAPSSAAAAHLSEKRIEKILFNTEIRRISAAEVRAVVAAPALRLASGAAEATSEHALLLLPVAFLTRQRSQLPEWGDSQQPHHAPLSERRPNR